MKQIGIIFAVLFTFSAHGEKICDSGQDFDEGQTELLTLVQNTNAAKDTIQSCAKRRPRSPENIERKIDFLLSQIKKIDAMPQSERDQYFRQRGNSMVNLLSPYYRSNNGRGQRSMLEMASGENRSEPDRQAIEKSIKETYLEFAKEYGCEPKLQPYSVFVSLGRVVRKNQYERRAQTLSKLSESLTSGELSKRHQELIETPGRLFYQSQDRVYNCSTKFVTDTNYRQYNKRLLAPCSKAFTHHFENNEWRLGQGSLNEIKNSSDFSELQSCIQNRMAFSGDVEIDKISVSSSSSSLNNTGLASKAFGKKGFEALSKARAQEAEAKILPLLLPNKDLNGSVTLNYKGLNGDGTSGPCPYYLDENGKELPKPGFKAGGPRHSELEKSKYVKIIVTFKSASKDVKEKVEFMGAKYPCQGVKLKCSE